MVKPDIRPSTKEERYLGKKLDKRTEERDTHKAALDHLKKIRKREQKKNVEYMRKICHFRSKDGKVNVCDMDDGPDRCNRNTLEDCPHYIFVVGDGS